jgi:hypothetical protein
MGGNTAAVYSHVFAYVNARVIASVIYAKWQCCHVQNKRRAFVLLYPSLCGAPRVATLAYVICLWPLWCPMGGNTIIILWTSTTIHAVVPHGWQYYYHSVDVNNNPCCGAPWVATLLNSIQTCFCLCGAPWAATLMKFIESDASAGMMNHILQPTLDPLLAIW